MLEKLNPIFSFRRRESSTVTPVEIATLVERFRYLPTDFLELLQEASILEVELLAGPVTEEICFPDENANILLFSLYSPKYVLDAHMHVAIQNLHDTEAVGVGTDLCDSMFVCMHGRDGWGLYLLRLTDSEETWVAPT